MNTIRILGTKISQINKKELKDFLNNTLSGSEKKYITTPNPEIILKTLDDEELYYIINNSDLALADGFGLQIAAILQGKVLRRFTGADLTQDLLSLAEKQAEKVYILNWRGGLSSENEISTALKSKYPKLIFAIQNINKKASLLKLNEINDFSPSIVFSCLGSPWQEKNIFHLQQKINSLKLYVGVGGRFDFITNKPENHSLPRL